MKTGVNSVTFKLAPESQMADQAEVDRVKGDGQSNYLTTGSSMDAMGIPYYQNQINEFLRNFTQAFNDIEKQGVTLDGDKMGAFFVGNFPNRKHVWCRCVGCESTGGKERRMDDGY